MLFEDSKGLTANGKSESCYLIFHRSSINAGFDHALRLAEMSFSMHEGRLRRHTFAHKGLRHVT